MAATDATTPVETRRGTSHSYAMDEVIVTADETLDYEIRFHYESTRREYVDLAKDMYGNHVEWKTDYYGSSEAQETYEWENERVTTIRNHDGTTSETTSHSTTSGTAEIRRELPSGAA